MPETDPSSRIVEIGDERDPLAAAALELVHGSFPRDERQPLGELRMALEEKRRGLVPGDGFFVLAALDDEPGPAGEPVGAVTGSYLDSINAGMIGYLAVRDEARDQGLGSRLRERLIECFRGAARSARGRDLDHVLGEIEQDSPWLARLEEEGRAVPFDVPYLQPSLSADRDPVPLVLYREPVAGPGGPLPAAEVARILFGVYREGYRIPRPLENPAFRRMLEAMGLL